MVFKLEILEVKTLQKKNSYTFGAQSYRVKDIKKLNFWTLV